MPRIIVEVKIMKTILILSLISLAACSSSNKQKSLEHHPPVVSGEIQIAPALEQKAAKGATLYIIAKSAAGGPPVAVKKMNVDSFPLSFELMPQDMMMQQGMSLDVNLIVTARIDKDGIAGPAEPGDLEGKTTQAVPLGTKEIKIKIDKAY